MTANGWKKRCQAGYDRFLANGRRVFEGSWFWIAIALVSALGFLSRIAMFDFVSNDVAAFLIGWYRIFYEKGIRVALAEDIGDYTPAYMYVLGFISLFRPAPESLSFVHALKYVSCLFDYVSAIFVLLLCLNRLRTEKWVALIGYTAALFLPTILLNSAFWGQCDSIFTAFCVASLYYLFGNHQRMGLILYGCAFAFKLQSVFLLPFLVYLVLVKRLKLRFFLYIPLVYLLFALPSAICGRDFLQILIIYGNQGASYPYLVLNAPSLYAFFSDSMSNEKAIVNYLIPSSVFAGLSLIGALMLVLYQKKREPDFSDFFEIAYFFALLAPFVLPKMHERYFYLADAFACYFFVVKPKKFYIALLSTFGSLTGYINYLFDFTWFRDDNTTLRIGALMILLALILTGYDLLFPKEQKSKKDVLTEGIDL